MPLGENKTVRLNIDTSQAEREIGNMARRVSGQIQTQLMQLGRLTAFGLAGYGAFRLISSPTGQQGMSMASQAYTSTQSAFGFSPSGARMQNEGLEYPNWYSGIVGSPTDYTGRNLGSAVAGYYGARDFGQRISGGLSGFALGTGATALMFGGGAALTAMGAMPIINSASVAMGRVAGGSLLGGATRAAGGLLAAPFRLAGFGGIASSISGGASIAAGGAAAAGRMVGGFMGGIAPIILGGAAVSYLGENIAMNIAAQRQIEDEVDRMSGRYTFGNATNIATGRGFGFREQSSIATFVRSELAEREFLRQADFRDIFRGITDSELDFNVRSAEEFKNKFEKVVTVIREIARTFETSLEGAVGLLGDMQRSGFYTVADQTAALFRSNALARYSGMSAQQMIGIGLQGAQAAGNYNLPAAFGTNLQTSLAAMLQMRPDFIDVGERDRFQQTLQELGGAEAVSGQLSNFLMRQAREDALVSVALYGLADPSRGQIDQQRLSDFMAGKLDFGELIAQGNMRITERGQQSFERFLNESDRYFGMLRGSETSQFFRGYLGSMSAGMGVEDIQTLLLGLGMDDQRLRYLASQTLFGRPMTSEAMMETAEMQRLAMNEQLLGRTPRGILEAHIFNPIERGFHSVSRPFVREFDAINQGVENFYNQFMLRSRLVNLSEDDLSLDAIQSGLNLQEIGGHQSRFLRTQGSITSALDRIIREFQLGAGQQFGNQGAVFASEVQEFRKELELLFEKFNEGRLSASEFTRQYDAMVAGLNTFTDAAAQSGGRLKAASQDLVAALEQLRSDELGLEAVGSSRGAAMGAALYEGGQRGLTVQQIRSAMGPDTSLSGDAQRIFEDLSSRTGLITREMFEEATRGLPALQKAAVMQRLARRARESGGTLQIEPGAYTDDLYTIRSGVENYGANLDPGLEQMFGDAMLRFVAQDQTSGSALPDPSIIGMFQQHYGPTKGRAGRNRFLGLALEGIEDPAVKEALSRFFSEYDDQNFFERLLPGSSALNFDRLHDIMSELGITDDESRSFTSQAAGRLIDMMSGLGLVNKDDIVMGQSATGLVGQELRGAMVKYRDRLEKDDARNLFGSFGHMTNQDFERLMRDGSFRGRLREGLGNIGVREVIESIRSELGGDPQALKLFDAIIQRAESGGADRVAQDMNFLDTLDVGLLAESRASINSLVQNRFSAIALSLKERAASAGRYTDAGKTLTRGADAIQRFVQGGGMFGDLSGLYTDDVITSLESGRFSEIATALGLGKTFQETGDIQKVLEQAQSSQLFHPDAIDKLSGITDKNEFGRILDFAIGTVLQNSAATTGANTLFEDQDPATLARVFGRTLGESEAIREIASANRLISESLSTLNTRLRDLESAIRTIK